MARTKWALEEVQKESNRIHNNKFIINSITIKKVGNQEKTASFLHITCKVCNYKIYNDYIIEECQVEKGTHLWVAEQEDEFINKYKKFKYIPKIKFGGYTECFNLDIVKEFNNNTT
ncbi:MAG: hypothetical protein H8D97_01425 [Proteobacteria bacterium]|nr:hypothetical protein [Pseudomonadota bacterium]